MKPAKTQAGENLRDDALWHACLLGTQLGHNDCVTSLQQTLDEEKATDKKLTAMVEGQINREAA